MTGAPAGRRPRRPRAADAGNGNGRLLRSRAMRPPGAVALLLTALVAAWPASAELAHAQSVAPAWRAEPEARDTGWGDAEHLVLSEPRRLVRRRLEDGVVVAQLDLPACEELAPGGARSPRAWFHCTDDAGTELLGSLDTSALTLRWSHELPGTSHALLERDGVLFVAWAGTEGGVRALDESDGRVLWTHATRWIEPDHTELLANDQVVLWRTSRRLSAHARTDGRVLWTRELGLDATASLHGGSLVLAERAGRVDGSVLGLDAATGLERWRFAASGLRRLVPIDADVLVETVPSAGAPSELVVLEAASGARRWALSTEAPRWLEASAGRLVVATEHELTALVARSGAILGRWPTERLERPRFDGRALLAVEAIPARAGHLGAHRLARFDLEPGSAWRSRAAVADAPSLEHAGLVLATTDSGIVRAFHAETGRPAWQSAIGLSVRHDGPLRVTGHHLVATGTRGRLHVFDLTRPRPAARRVTVRGRVQADTGSVARIAVLVADRWTRTDAVGRFRVTVQTAGPITARVDASDEHRLCARAEPVELEPGDGRAPVIVLELRADPCVCEVCD